MNADLIKALRCKECFDLCNVESCRYHLTNTKSGCKCAIKLMATDAATALEAAEKRVKELEAALQNWHEDYHDNPPEAAQRWIPCAERVPEPQTKVLIRMTDRTFKHAYTTIAAHIGYHDAKAEDDWQEYEGETEYDEENDCFWVHPCWYEVNMVDDNPNYELDDDYEVTHWQPLPQPPEKGE